MLKLKLVTLILISMIPQSINNYVVRHQEGISIRVSKKSPPLAIFEDEQLKPKMMKQIVPVVTVGIPLRSGMFDLTKRALEIARKVATETVVAVAEDELVPAKDTNEIVRLSGIKIQKNSPNVMMLLKALPKSDNGKPPPPQTIQERDRAQDIVEYRPDSTKNPYQQFEDIKRFYLRNQIMGNLTASQRARLEGVKNLDSVLAADWSQPTFEQQAKKLLSNNDSTRQPSLPDTGVTVADNRDMGEDQTEMPLRTAVQPTSAEASLLAEPQLLISGPIEMADGLAYLGNDQYIKVYRQAGTTLLEEGNVVIKEGRYEIFVRNPQDGVVVAELRTIDQQILGRGEILLNETIRNQKTYDDLRNIPLKIKPVVGSANIVTVSGYSFDDEQKVDGASVSINDFMDLGKTDSTGKDSAQILTDSTMVIRAQKDGFWGSMLFKTAGQVFKHTLFGDETVRSWFEQLNIGASKLKKTGIIWGEVKIGSVSISDAEIEVVSSEQALQPTYFVGGVIPDASLKATTSNGRFAIFDVDPGIYIVRARHKGKLFPPQVVVVDRGFVSTVTVQWQKKSQSEVYVFDLETSEPMPSEIKFIGSDKTAYSKTGKHIVNFSGKEGIQVLEARTDSTHHFVSRATVDKAQKQVMIPVVSYEWITAALARTRINQNVDRGIIVGIARKADMRIELDPLGIDNETDIVYFDSKGDILVGGTSAPLGGGFIIFNAVPGVRTILMNYKGIQQTQIHTALSDPDVINVFNPNY